MNKNSYQITISRSADGKASEVVLVPAGKTGPVRLQAQAGGSYTLTDRATDKAPQQIHARRQGKNLLLQLDENRPLGEPDLILENFYEGTPGTVVGLAEDGSTYRFIPNTAQSGDQLSALTDGSQASQVLGGPVYAGELLASTIGVAAAPLVTSGGAMWGALGPAGVGVAALVGAAALGGGGGGGGGGGSGSGAGVATSFSAGFASGDDTGGNSTDRITNKAQPRLVGTVPPGNKVLVKVDGQDAGEAVVDAQGNWSWTPPSALADGDHRITFAAVDANNNRTERVVDLTVDTGKLVASYSSNFASLNTEPVGNPDSKLNIKETDNGVLVTLTLNEPLERDLSRDDLSLYLGNTLLPTSQLEFNKLPNLNKYELQIEVPFDATGQMLLKWSDKGKLLRDVAGNGLDNPNLQWTLDIDTQAPAVVLFRDELYVDYTAGKNLNLSWAPLAPNNTGDLASISASLLGQTLRKTNDFNNIALKSEGGLSGFKEGYYTLRTTFTDQAGNEEVVDNILVVDRGGLKDDAWDVTLGDNQVGDKEVQLFINRSGNQTLTGGPDRNSGARDIYVWLAQEAGGKPGRPDVDTITDFLLGQDGQSDILDIKDLLGLSSPTNPLSQATLSKFVNVVAFDKDNNGSNDSTRVSISRSGAFAAGANVSSLAEQVILLDGVVASNLDALLPNLDWQATGAVILA